MADAPRTIPELIAYVLEKRMRPEDHCVFTFRVDDRPVTIAVGVDEGAMLLAHHMQTLQDEGHTDLDPRCTPLVEEKPDGQ